MAAAGRRAPGPADSGAPVWRLDHRPLEYADALRLQRELVRRRRRGDVPDVLLLTEHPPVFTLGTTSSPEHLLEPEARLRADGAEVCATDRGGDVTFHGPGQLVVYPIVDLAAWKRDLHAYLRALEAVVIAAAAGCGVRAQRRAGLTGVWCGAPGDERKLASIGVRVSRWVASHGAAVNVTTDLDWFSRIVPCGIRDCRVTSIEVETGARRSLDEMADRVAAAFRREFGRRETPAPSGLVEDLLSAASRRPALRGAA